MHAITLNGVAIDKNKRAFDLGRLAAAAPETIARLTQKRCRHRHIGSQDRHG